jgi:hypothetical protein
VPVEEPSTASKADIDRQPIGVREVPNSTFGAQLQEHGKMDFGVLASDEFHYPTLLNSASRIN